MSATTYASGIHPPSSECANILTPEAVLCSSNAPCQPRGTIQLHPTLTLTIANQKQLESLKWPSPLSPNLAIFPIPQPNQPLPRKLACALGIITQPINRHLQFIIAQLAALASHHTIGWVNHDSLAADDLLETHTFLFTDGASTVDISDHVFRIEESISHIVNNSEEAKDSLAGRAKLRACLLPSFGTMPTIFRDFKQFLDEQTTTKWTISPDYTLSVTTDGSPSYAAGTYDPCPSNDPTEAAFLQKPDEDGFCKRLIIKSESETDKTWIATLQVNRNFPTGKWEFWSRFRIRSV